MKVSNPLISIIIPACNAASFIESAIKSAIDQTYRPLEIIVVDDGSNDGTADIVELMIIPEVRLFRQQNTGVSEARNRGVQEAKGEWIVFLDADDLLLPDCLNIHWQHQQELSRDQMHVGAYLRNGVYQKIPEHNMQVYTPWLPLFSKKALQKAGGFDTQMPYAEDIELIINLRAHGYSFVNSDEPVYHYRIGLNENSITSKKRDWKVIQYFFLKHKDHFHSFTTAKEYYRLFMIILFTNQDGLNELYKFLRYEMPFFVHPPQYLYSRVVGYILWYGGYVFPFEWWHRFLGSNIKPSFQTWLQKHKL